MGFNLQFLSGSESLGVPVKQCSRTGKRVLTPAKQEHLRKSLEHEAIPIDDREEIKELVDAILAADLASIRSVVTKYSMQVQRFELLRTKIAELIPVLTDGALEVVESAPYKLTCGDNKVLDVINLSLKVSGSNHVVGIPTHPLVRIETLKLISMANGSGYLEPDHEHEAKWVLAKLSRAHSVASLPPPPPVYSK